MDFYRFLDSNFDSKDWINAAFSDPEAQKNKEQYAQSLVMKLQLFSQEVSKSLEDTSQQIVHTMPRILRDVDSMQKESMLLQNRMQSVQKDVQKVEQETAQAMESLLKIDTVKSRMHAVEKALKEIDNWTSLTADIDDVFSSANVDLMSERLARLQQCLRVLGTKVNDYKERRNFVEGLKDQFLSAISPSVVGAFTSQQTENIQYFAKIFADLDRMKDMEQCYAKCLKSTLSDQWTTVLSENVDIQSAAEMLCKLHDCILSIYFSQLAKSESIFGSNSNKIVSESVALAIQKMEPSMETILEDKLSNSVDQLATLTAIRQTCDNFVKSLAQPNLSSEFLFIAIYNPIVQFALNYQNYQQSLLLDRVNIWNFDDKDLMANCKNFKKSIEIIFDNAEKAIDQCHNFVGDIGLGFVVKAVQTYLSNYLSRVRKMLSAIGNDENMEENWNKIDALLVASAACGNLLEALNKLEEYLLIAYERLVVHWPIDQILELNQTEKGERFETMLMDQPKIRATIQDLYAKIGNGTSASASFLPDIEKQTIKLTNRIMKMAMEQIVGSAALFIEAVPKLPTWSSSTLGESLSSDLPAFGLTPQEYITKVGQYLVTFAHHLEPFMSSEDLGMLKALQIGTLPYSETVDFDDSSENVIRVWLSSAATGIMNRYAEMSLRIRHLSMTGAQQLAADIEYLCNVVEDLGLNPNEDLLQLKTLLVMDLNQMKTIKGYLTPLVAALREIRKESDNSKK